MWEFLALFKTGVLENLLNVFCTADYVDYNETPLTTHLPATTPRREYYYPPQSRDIDSVYQDIQPGPAHVEQSVFVAKEVKLLLMYLNLYMELTSCF
jgi:hypothetical protein